MRPRLSVQSLERHPALVRLMSPRMMKVKVCLMVCWEPLQASQPKRQRWQSPRKKGLQVALLRLGPIHLVASVQSKLALQRVLKRRQEKELQTVSDLFEGLEVPTTASVEPKRSAVKPEEPERKRQKKDSRASASVSKSLQTWEEKQKTFCDESLWENKINARALTALTKALENASSKIITDEEHKEVVQKMLDFPDAVQEKFNLFADLRKNPTDFVKQTLPENRKEILQGLGPALLGKIVLSTATALLKDCEDCFGRCFLGIVFRVT